MDDIIRRLPELARQKRSVHKTFLTKLKKKPPPKLDYVVHELHDQTFENTDCLQCANCCKTTGPLFTEKDISRISKHLRLKSQKFIVTYLKVDEEDDYVLQKVPCAFLDDQNYCSIYSVRPKACREYPHTNRKKFHQIANLTLQNVAICPAAYTIVEKLREKMET